jgi:hypothetical protein
MPIGLPDPTEGLLRRLRAACPIEATCQPALVAALRARDAFRGITPRRTVTKVNDMDDAAGIVCGVDFGAAAGAPAVVVSITHLSFAADHPLARDIAAYQTHRIAWLRQQDAARQEARPGAPP